MNTGNNMVVVKRGDIFLADLGEQNGSVQGGMRPVVVLQNDIGNRFSPTTLVCPLTSQKKKNMPTHVSIPISSGVEKESVALCEQLRVINKNELKRKICNLTDDSIITKINQSIIVSLGLSE